MSDRAELDRLRKMKRLRELQAKAGDAPEAAKPEAPAADEPGAWEKFKNFAGAMGDAGAKAVSLGYLNTPEMQENIKKSPTGAAVGTVAGSLIPGAGSGKLAAFLGKAGKGVVPALSRIAANTGVAGAEGFARKPEGEDTLDNRLSNAKMQAALAGVLSSGVEGVAGAARMGRGVMKSVGKGLANLTPKEADAYVRNPQMADDLAQMNREDPIGLSDKVRREVRGGLDEAFDRVSRPTLDRLGEMGAGKSVRVNPADFSNTAAGKEMERVWATQGRQAKYDVPVFEKVPVEASPVKSGFRPAGDAVEATPVTTGIRKAGKPSMMTPVEFSYKQGKDIKMSPVKSVPAEADVMGRHSVVRAGDTENFAQEVLPQVRRSGKLQPTFQPTEPFVEQAGKTRQVFQPIEPYVEKAGEAKKLEDLILPRGTQQIRVPRPMPEEGMNMTWQQALNAKRASQDAANHARQLNPIGYNPANDADALAGSNMRKAMEGAVPESAPLNDVLEQSSRYATHAKETLKNNPAAILTDSESVGSVPTRAMRQFLDENAGTNLDEMAQALGAGRAMSDPNRVSGVTDKLAHWAGKHALRGASKLPDATPKNDSLAAILSTIFGGQK